MLPAFPQSLLLQLGVGKMEMEFVLDGVVIGARISMA